MALTHDQFFMLSVALLFVAIAIAEFLGSKGSKTIDIIVGVLAFLLFAWIMISYLHF